MIFPGAHAQDIPTNMLAHFDQEECPHGWERAEIPGRSLLDRGNYIGSRSDGVMESVVFPFGTKGGEASHLITIAEVASHRHDAGQAGSFFASQGSMGESWGLKVGGEFSGGVGRIGYTGAAGNSQPHNNMPPYYVATLCRKKAENVISDLIVKVSELNIAVEELKRGLKSLGPQGPAGPQGTPGVPGNAGKDGAPGKDGASSSGGPLIENSDTYAIAGLVVGIAGAFLNGVGVCVLFLRRGTEDVRALERMNEYSPETGPKCKAEGGTQESNLQIFVCNQGH